MFKIISTGWECADFIERTLVSVLVQTREDWEIMIIDDASSDPRQAQIIRQWCRDHDERWLHHINKERKGTVRNQVEGIRAMDPEDDDIIVFLDLDGDQLAHPNVLQHLADAYSDDTLVTYGSLEPVPFVATCGNAKPFPRNVVRTNSYRQHIAEHGATFNHLRTMKGKVFWAISEDQFHWQDGRGWYEHGTDYIFMIAALELANGRYKYIPETLLLYNHANPNADYLIRSKDSPLCVEDYLSRPQLAPLETS